MIKFGRKVMVLLKVWSMDGVIVRMQASEYRRMITHFLRA